jgi:hypothetical protein
MLVPAARRLVGRYARRGKGAVTWPYLKSKLEHPGPHLLEIQRVHSVLLKVMQQFHVQQIDGTAFGGG